MHLINSVFLYLNVEELNTGQRRILKDYPSWDRSLLGCVHTWSHYDKKLQPSPFISTQQKTKWRAMTKWCSLGQRKSWIWCNILFNATWHHATRYCVGQRGTGVHFWWITLWCEFCICAVCSEIIMSQNETVADRMMLQSCIILSVSIKHQCAVFWSLGLVLIEAF